MAKGRSAAEGEFERLLEQVAAEDHEVVAVTVLLLLVPETTPTCGSWL